MTGSRPSEERARAAYDMVADAYDAAFRDELEAKPLDRALLDAVAELSAAGPLLDLGCGPGHVSAYLSRRHPDVAGVDLSPKMVALARRRRPGLAFEVGSMLDLAAPDGSVQGIVALYSITHLEPSERGLAVAEMARTLRPGGWLLVAFHIEDDEHPPGGAVHLTSFLGHDVDLVGHFIAPEDARETLEGAGLTVTAEMTRTPSGSEYPSRRCYLLARRGG